MNIGLANLGSLLGEPNYDASAFVTYIIKTPSASSIAHLHTEVVHYITTGHVHVIPAHVHTLLSYPMGESVKTTAQAAEVMAERTKEVRAHFNTVQMLLQQIRDMEASRERAHQELGENPA